MATVTRKSSKSKPNTLTVSLCLAIDHQAYIVSPIATEDSEVLRAWRLAKQGADGAVYSVALTTTGHMCECGDFTFKRDGLDPAGCKHIRASVMAGLLEASGQARDARPCCPATEPAPCKACVPADVFPPDRVNPDDAESDPELWPSWTDEDLWSLIESDPIPDGDDDHLLNRSEPSESDLADYRRWIAEVDARQHLQGDRLTLLQLVEKQRDFYANWKNAAGTMLAEHLETLCELLRVTGASSPAEHDARLDVLDHQYV